MKWLNKHKKILIIMGLAVIVPGFSCFMLYIASTLRRITPLIPLR